MKTAKDFVPDYNAPSDSVSVNIQSKNASVLRLEVCKQLNTATSMRECVSQVQESMLTVKEFECTEIYAGCILLTFVIAILLLLLCRK